MENTVTVRNTREESWRNEMGEAARRVEKSVSDVRHAATATLDDAKFGARRLIKRGRYSAEEYVADAIHQVRQKPLHALGIAVAVGAVLGLFLPRGRKT